MVLALWGEVHETPLFISESVWLLWASSRDSYEDAMATMEADDLEIISDFHYPPIDFAFAVDWGGGTGVSSVDVVSAKRIEKKEGENTKMQEFFVYRVWGFRVAINYYFLYSLSLIYIDSISFKWVSGFRAIIF